MNRFFVNPNNISNKNIIISGDDVNHISKVLRLKISDEIIICDGNNIEYLCEIISINKKEVISYIKEKYINKSEPNIKITLFQGLPKAQKMDLIIQKCVEIGVVNIQPVITSRVVVKAGEDSISNKVERWNKISLEASKQSGRGYIPKIFQPVKYEEAIALASSFDLSIIPYENEKTKGLKEVLKNKTSSTNVGIFIGPEGGFNDIEISNAINHNIIPVTLGPRILRTETAGFTSAAIVLYEIGDMGGNI